MSVATKIRLMKLKVWKLWRHRLLTPTNPRAPNVDNLEASARRQISSQWESDSSSAASDVEDIVVWFHLPQVHKVGKELGTEYTSIAYTERLAEVGRPPSIGTVG
jgi:hypothetical protein